VPFSASELSVKISKSTPEDIQEADEEFESSEWSEEWQEDTSDLPIQFLFPESFADQDTMLEAIHPARSINEFFTNPPDRFDWAQEVESSVSSPKLTSMPQPFVPCYNLPEADFVDQLWGAGYQFTDDGPSTIVSSHGTKLPLPGTRAALNDYLFAAGAHTSLDEYHWLRTLAKRGHSPFRWLWCHTFDFARLEHHLASIFSQGPSIDSIPRIQALDVPPSDVIDAPILLKDGVVPFVSVLPTLPVLLNDRPTQIILDTGTAISVMNEEAYLRYLSLYPYRRRLLCPSALSDTAYAP
jgi:hypothetical protein